MQFRTQNNFNHLIPCNYVSQVKIVLLIKFVEASGDSFLFQETSSIPFFMIFLYLKEIFYIILPSNLHKGIIINDIQV